MNIQHFQHDPIDAAAVRRRWPDILALVAGRSKKAAAIVNEATVLDVDGTTLVLTLKHGAHANMLAASPDVLIAALSEIFGGEWSVRVETFATSPSPGKRAPAATGPYDPVSDTHELLRDLHQNHNVDGLPATDQIAIAQVNATLAVAHALSEVEDAIRANTRIR